MGRRSEQRIAINFPVVVRGSDTRGNAFAIKAETHDISLSGASLKGLNTVAEPGMKLEIECQNQKAWHHVQWVGQNGTPRAGRIGVQRLEPGKYIWGVPPREWKSDTYDLSKVASFASGPTSGSPTDAEPGSLIGRQPRQFGRHECCIETRLTIEDGSSGSIALPGKITDISLGGCYVETLSPLPVDTNIRLSFAVGDSILQVSGEVRSSQTGFGMGVSFTGVSAEDYKTLRQFAAPGQAPEAALVRNTSQDAIAPRVQTTKLFESASSSKTASRPYSEPDADLPDVPPTPEAIEAIVRLLLRKGLLTRAELADEFANLKTVKT